MKTQISPAVLHLAININAGIEPYTWTNRGEDGCEPVYLQSPDPGDAFQSANFQANDWGFGYDEFQNWASKKQLTKKDYKQQHSGYRMYLATNDPDKVAKMEKYNSDYIARYATEQY